MPSGLFYLNSLDHFQCFIEIPVFNINNVDPDQMPHSLGSDLSLHCFPMSLLWDLNGVKTVWVRSIIP